MAVSRVTRRRTRTSDGKGSLNTRCALSPTVESGAVFSDHELVNDFVISHAAPRGWSRWRWKARRALSLGSQQQGQTGSDSDGSGDLEQRLESHTSGHSSRSGSRSWRCSGGQLQVVMVQAQQPSLLRLCSCVCFIVFQAVAGTTFFHTSRSFARTRMRSSSSPTAAR